MATFMKVFMNKNVKNNFMWQCDPCLVKFEVSLVQNDHERIDALENKYSKIDQQLDLIKSMLLNSATSGESSLHNSNNGESSLHTGTSSNSGESALQTTLVQSNKKNSSNAWSNKSRVEIMKDNLGNHPNLVSLESSLLNKSINPGVSKKTKDGRTVIICDSIADADALKDAASSVFPDHNCVVKKPKKSVIRIVGFQS